MILASNKRVLRVLRVLEAFYQHEKDVGRSLAFGRAVEVLREHDQAGRGLAAVLARSGVPGFGPSLTAVVKEADQSGTCRRLRDLGESVPSVAWADLLELRGVGTETAWSWWEDYGIVTPTDLRAYVKQDPSAPAAMVRAAQQAERSVRRRRSQVVPVAERLRRRLARVPGVRRVAVAGSLRRKSPTVRDIDLLVEVTSDATRKRVHTMLALAEEVGGPQRLRVVLDGQIRADVLMVSAREWGSALQYLTGSAAFNIRLRRRARDLGWSLSEHGLTSLGEGRPYKLWFPDERGLFRFLGQSYVKPEVRE